MGQYLEISFLTISGVRRIIDLGPVYGECIVYDDNIPKYHVAYFNEDVSNQLLKSLVDNDEYGIENLLTKINSKNGTKLSLGKGWPLIVINKTERSVNLDLIPVPIELIKSIT